MKPVRSSDLRKKERQRKELRRKIEGSRRIRGNRMKEIRKLKRHIKSIWKRCRNSRLINS